MVRAAFFGPGDGGHEGVRSRDRDWIFFRTRRHQQLWSCHFDKAESKPQQKAAKEGPLPQNA